MKETVTDIGLLGIVMVAVIMIVVLFYNGCSSSHQPIKMINPSAIVNSPVPLSATQVPVILPSPTKVIDWRKLPLNR